MIIRHVLPGVLLALATVTPAQAQMHTTPAEIAMLPAYCDAKIGRKLPESVDYWRDRMRHENWIHIHHYCSGLIELNRYYRSARGRQRANLGNAVNEFSGMLRAWTPDFFLRPEAHLNRGKAYRLMGNQGQALGDFLKALELNPRLTSATTELADLYRKTGKKAEALAVIRQGLEHSPESKSLRRRYQELGGDPKDIPEKAVEPAVVQAEPRVEPEAAASEAASREPVQLIEPKIGNETNPWCRFCPVEASDPPGTGAN